MRSPLASDAQSVRLTLARSLASLIQPSPGRPHRTKPTRRNKDTQVAASPLQPASPFAVRRSPAQLRRARVAAVTLQTADSAGLSRPPQRWEMESEESNWQLAYTLESGQPRRSPCATCSTGYLRWLANLEAGGSFAIDSGWLAD